MGAYIERYVYDAVGNFLRMQHIGSDPAHPGFSRSYDYDEPSLIEPAKRSNRLSRTALGDGNGLSEHYVYDAHGNTTRMPHLGGAHPDPNIVWDYRDQQHRVDLGGGGVAYYAYNAGGQRVRKVWEKSVSLVEERLYLGGFEIWRRRNGAGDLLVERETLHVMDEEQRIALVETRTVAAPDADDGPPQLIRYQLSNHLGSASLELDDQARVISYEEWTPYGSTSYQAVRSQTETAKRYRFTGKERDEESGLYYHGARYYAPWLGRWTACDRVGTRAGPNLYRFVDDNPVKLVDPSGLWPEFVDNLGASLGRAVDRIADDPLSAAGGAALAVLDNATMGAGTLVNDFIQGEQGATARGIGSNPAAAEAYTIVSIAQPLIEVGIGGTILIGGGGGGAAATAGTGGLGAPVTVPVAVGSTVVGAVLIAHGGLSLMTAIPRVQAVRAHMSSMDDSAGGGGYDPRRSQQQAKARDRAKSREATLQDRAEQAEGLPSTREGAEDLDRLEDVYGPEARDHLAEHGEMPEGAPVQNHHPERIADAPEQARRGGRLLDPRAHHRGAHQNRTNRPTEPGAPIEPPEGGYGVRDTDRSTRGRQTGQMTEEELDAEMYRQGRYGPALDE
jgi:RHS repeat-associated protein